MALSGIDEEATNTERFIGALQSLRAVLRDFSEELRRSSERSVLVGSGIERIEKAVGELSRTVLEIKHHIVEARGDIDRWTPVQGVPLLDPAQYPLGGKRDDSGSAVAFKDGKVKFALPGSWVGALLKSALSAGGGALLLRGVQWLATGH